MKRPRNLPATPRLSRDAERLVALARGLSASGSRVEDAYWEALLERDLVRLLDSGSDAALDQALDHLFQARPPAYDMLIEAAETHAESGSFDQHDNPRQALLVAAPILAWSKYAIPSGPIGADAAQALRAHFQAHVAAIDTRVAMMPYLYSIDQLPKNFSETRALTRQLAAMAAATNVSASKKSKKMPETAPLLADTRYLLGVIVNAPGAALFRWQEEDEIAGSHSSGKSPKPEESYDAREAVLVQWRAQAQPNLTAALPGCVFELQLPDAFHAACRESDRAIRPYSIKAALAFLEAALNVEPKQLRAVLGMFGEEQPEEYRIGFTKRNSADVLHGAIWPLYGLEEELAAGNSQEQIETLLRESGVGESVALGPLFPMEFCDDCGSPLFADPAGELVHAELPEDTEAPSAKHLH